MSDNVQNEQSMFLYKLKLTIAVFLPLAIIASVVIGVFYFWEMKVKKSAIEKHTDNMTTMQIGKLSNDFRHIVTDLMFFASYHQTLRTLDNLENNEGEYKVLNNDFALFSRGSKLYDQIRILNTKGMEILRVNYNGTNPVIVPKDQLQFKGNRYYFIKTIDLKKGEFFISPFDLNVEQNMIEEPLKPMIRFSTPIFDEHGEKRGVLVFNYLGENLIRGIKDLVIYSPGYYMLLNSDGYWIVGRSSEDEWGFMYEDRKNLTMGNAFPAAWGKITESESGQFYNADGLFTFKTIYPIVGSMKFSTVSVGEPASYAKAAKTRDYYWKIVSYIPASTFMEEENMSRNKYIMIDIMILSLLGLITLFLSHIAGRRKQAQRQILKQNKELSEQAAALEESRIRIELALKGGNLGSWDVNFKTDHMVVNDRWAEMLGHRPEAIQASTRDIWISTIDPKDRDRVLAIGESYRKGERSSYEVEYRVLRKDGEELWLFSKGEIVERDARGKTIRMAGIVMDLTDRKKAEKELAELAQHLEDLNQEKNRFLGMAAHDLRNPLICIRGFSEMLLAGDIGPVNEDHFEFLTMINTASQQMLDLVHDLLDVSVIECGKLTLRLTRGSLKDLLEERLKIIKITGEKKEITLHTDLQEVSEIDFDRDRIAQVVDNLLSNAIKFSPTGSNVHITLSQKSNHAQIDVRDEGPGLSEEDQSNLFGTFQKLSAAPTGGEKSTGLGLSIVKKIIEAHRGGIEVQSQVGSGSTFSFKIPLEAKNE